MPPARRIQAVFLGADAYEDDDQAGVVLRFRPLRARLDVDRVEQPVELGPALTIPAVEGLGAVLRILRAARIAAPRDPLALVGDVPRIEALLARAEGTKLVLSLRRRSRVSFVAWTEGGVETVDDVADVIEGEAEYLVLRHGERLPIRFPRDRITRGQTQREAWYQVLGIERP